MKNKKYDIYSENYYAVSIQEYEFVDGEDNIAKIKVGDFIEPPCKYDTKYSMYEWYEEIEEVGIEYFKLFATVLCRVDHNTGKILEIFRPEYVKEICEMEFGIK